jgi:pimeloyl-ACP methyl ester carboxylesterase
MCTKRALLIAATFGALVLLTMAGFRRSAKWSDPAAHKIGFLTASGVRLQCLDWGGSGLALILIDGCGDNPHIFDDFAPAFTDRIRVIAYARRGHGESEAKEPYDRETLAEDLRGVPDRIAIANADTAEI